MTDELRAESVSRRNGRSGERMSLEQARGVLGDRVAFTAHGGQWVTGKLIAISEHPQVVVEHPDGTMGHYTLHTVEGWAAEPGGPS